MALIEMREITKQFGQQKVNNRINMSVEQGEIHALLGENGAGKSTLMNILFGLLQPDSGEIRLQGKPVTISDPLRANQLGIGMVHQHFMLISDFTVTENIILGEEKSTYGWISMREREEEIRSLSQRYNLRVDPTAKISDISVGMQQRVEILKTLYRGADILIFDEPTAVLTPYETDELLQIMKKLARDGKTVIFITHKLKEIIKACDRVTVIRKGEVIHTSDVANVNEDQLATWMVGREVSFQLDKTPSEASKPVLTITDLVVHDHRGVPVVNQLNLSVKAGEIVGLAGIDGNGQKELIEAIAGLRRGVSGSIKLNEKNIMNVPPKKINESGLGHIPEDRHRRGLVLNFSIAENLILKDYFRQPFCKNVVMQEEPIHTNAVSQMEQYDIRAAHPKVSVDHLSGGNQQKVIIAREIAQDPDLLLAVQPTRGLDVGAIEFIHRQLLDQREKGKAILLVSLELDEVLQLSDRIAVIHQGYISGWVNPNDTTEREIGLLMTGIVNR